MTVEAGSGSAARIAAAVRAGERTAPDVVEQSLSRIAVTNGAINAFTDVLAERARGRAAALQQLPPAERARLPLAGVPFAVKNLFDVAGLRTRAGSRILMNRARPRAMPKAPPRSRRMPRYG